MKGIKFLLPLVIAAFAAACSDDGNGTGVDLGELSGSVSFSFQGGGADAGNFRAEGQVPSNGALGNWAGGIRTSADDSASIGITGSTKSGSDYDMMTLVIEGITTGDYSFSEECGTHCAYGAVVFDLAAQGDDTSRVCTFTSGEVHLTSITSTTAKGTFSGTGTCVANGQLEDEEFRVNGGTFDVKVAGQSAM